MNIVLASKSPRRIELLKFIVPKFDVIPAEIEEVVPQNISVMETAEYLAVQKAVAVFGEHRDCVVIGCDTVVIIDNVVLGKPSDETQARRMLKTLSGRTHKVITGVCVFHKTQSKSFSETTEVEFYTLTDNEIDEYISTGDPFDKAGSYGIQEKGAFLVRRINGDFYNVMGLPVGRLKREISSIYN